MARRTRQAKPLCLKSWLPRNSASLTGGETHPSGEAPLPKSRLPRNSASLTGAEGFAFVVKVVQSWGRSPTFQHVPEEMREFALAAVSFEAEPRVYRSDLADRLPPGLTMPRAYAVVDLDAESTALWLEDVPVVAARWERAALAHAAHLLGRLAASPRVRPLATVADPGMHRTLRGYVEERIELQVIPALHDDAIWRHPVVTPAFDDTLRHDLVAAADTLPTVVAELESMANGTAHGDACTRNLLVAADRADLILIDFGFWGPQPLGFDLGQLLLGEVQLGERPAVALPDDERACLAAYVDGLRAEDCDVDGSVVERGLAPGDAAVRRAAVAAVRAPRRPADPCGDRDLPAAGGRGAVRPRSRRCHRPARPVMMGGPEPGGAVTAHRTPSLRSVDASRSAVTMVRSLRSLT